MAVYAIGDIQGCFHELNDLLDAVAFAPGCDELLLVGDLINRGPQNLETVRLIMSLGDTAVSVLGNHDLHFLAVCLGGHKPGRSDTFHDLLDAPDRDAIVDWYRRQPLLVVDERFDVVIAHAGVPHIWSVEAAAAYAAEVEAVIQGDGHADYFAALYGNEPACWSDSLTGMPRWRIITNYFTRMRLIQEDGTLDFSHKGAVAQAPSGYQPWYELRAGAPLGRTLLFGHWAALDGHTGLSDVLALDTGCVWGRTLTAFRLDTGELFQVPARDG